MEALVEQEIAGEIKPPPMIGYLVHGSTGCSCCQSDNFISGLYETDEAALEAALRHQKSRTVRSQYSDTGIYTVIQVEYWKWYDSIIISGRVLDESFYESGEIAEHIRWMGKSIIST